MGHDNPRRRRLAAEIQRELADLLRRDVKDSRIGNVTITHVDVTGDLREARVYYLIFGRDGGSAEVQRGLDSAAGFLRNAVAKSLAVRYTPTLKFELDETVQRGMRMTELIEKVAKDIPPKPDGE
jgi:ribosome-binding factor A